MKWKVIAIVSILIAFTAIVWAKTTSLTELDETPAQTDVFPIVDRSDTTMAGTGTNKGLEIHNLFGRRITAQTANYTLTADDNSIMFTNAQTAANVTFTLPECTATTEGWWASFYVMDTNYEMYIDPHANDSIANVSPNENGEYIYGDKTVGSVVSVTCMKGDDGDYDIYTTGHSGTWTAQD